MKKGIDFLADIHLGNAPPKDFILRNLKINEDEYRNEITTEEVVDRTMKSM